MSMLANIAAQTPAPPRPSVAPSAKIVLRLYVTGRTPSAAQAISAVTSLHQDLGPDRLTLEVIDVLDDPISALNDEVFATPTILRIKPGPVRRLFGNIASPEMLLAGLQLVPGIRNS